MSLREKVAGWVFFNGMNADHQDVVEFTPEYEGEPDNHDGRYVLVREDLLALLEGDEEPVEAPETIYYDDGGELLAWSWGAECPLASDAEIPESVAEDAPRGWSVFDGEVFTLTEEQAASDDFIDGIYGRMEAGTQWWQGHLRPATAAEVCAFFRLARPSTTEEVERLGLELFDIVNECWGDEGPHQGRALDIVRMLAGVED